LVCGGASADGTSPACLKRAFVVAAVGASHGYRVG